MRAIDGDALKKALVEYMDAFLDSDGRMMYSDHLLCDADYEDLCKFIDNQPTIHLEIIRCKDCRLYTQPKQGKVYGRCTFTRDSAPRKQTDFCSYARRRQNEQIPN